MLRVVLFSILSVLLHTGWALAESVNLEGDLTLPTNYLEFKRQSQERDQWIPATATATTNPGSFGLKVVEYHLADVLKNNRWARVKSVESLQKALRPSTRVGGESFTIKTKLDLNRMRAELGVESFINAQFWTENSLKTIRSQLKLMSASNSLVSLENSTDALDTRTYLNVQKSW